MHRIVVLGKITGAFGIAGWVKVDSYTEPLDNILRYPEWRLLRDAPRAVDEAIKPLQSRMTAKGLQVQLTGVVDRTQAERFAGMLIGVPRDWLPAPAHGEYYWDDLIGLEAYTPNGVRLGQIAEIRATAAHPLLVITENRSGERVDMLVPLVTERLVSVDLDTKRATIDWDRTWS